ncbi:unnamed protein product [Leptidea sinapis]|uniref:Uncharacterized protein n=1 Tax=Leptidea sinapis TaxID=189913 RepID=A0A5E4QUE5_9NEOP|nr:unnamed protein product [Leptidea sinapis]
MYNWKRTCVHRYLSLPIIFQYRQLHKFSYNCSLQLRYVSKHCLIGGYKYRH